MMRTTLDIDQDLLREAQAIGETRTKRETVERALAEFISGRRRERLRGMLGKTDIALAGDALDRMRAED
jgi:Arc/MetJ family transcription regulator